jgi:hypothetical protein
MKLMGISAITVSPKCVHPATGAAKGAIRVLVASN